MSRRIEKSYEIPYLTRDNNAEGNAGIGTNFESENISHSNLLPQFAVKWMGKEMRPERDGVTTTSTAATRVASP